MQRDPAHKVGTQWGNRVEGERWPFDVPVSLDNFRNTRMSLRSHLEVFVPDAQHAVAVDQPDGPVVIALTADAVYTVRVDEVLDDGAGARIECRRVPLDQRSPIISVTGLLVPKFGTVFRIAEWEFHLREGETLTLTSETHVDGNPDDEELLARELAARYGWDVPGEALEQAAA